MIRLLGHLGIPDPAEVLERYPHELSGGMRQRVLIAMAFSCEPTLVIADEPTTALDVTTQAQILRLLETLQAERRVATLFVTHDLGVVAHLAHRVAVMYAGCLVESAPTGELFRAPAHPYTQGLLAQVLRADVRAEASAALDGLMPVLTGPPAACPFRERCPQRMAVCDETMPAAPRGQRRPRGRLPPPRRAGDGYAGRRPAARDPGSPDPLPPGRLAQADALAARCRRREPLRSRARRRSASSASRAPGRPRSAAPILRLVEPTGGEVHLGGQEITRLSQAALRPVRRRMQIVFQNPYASLNPRRRVGAIVGQPLAVHRVPGDHVRMVGDLLERVGLPPGAARRYPHEFSGGQRQRIAIARALALRPDLVVADEITSGLDVTVKLRVLALLRELQVEFHVAYLFISHDLGVVRQVADRVAVMYLGQIVEEAPTEALFQRPLHPYTQVLQASVPPPDPTAPWRPPVLSGDPPSPLSIPPGCRFHPRCPIAEARCRVEPPGAARARAGPPRRVSPGDVTEDDARRRAAELWQEGCRLQMAGKLDGRSPPTRAPSRSTRPPRRTRTSGGRTASRGSSTRRWPSAGGRSRSIPSSATPTTTSAST